ncbi:MAG TPA: hypothetical protein VFD51_01320 [Patescibacteria group bacterium]|nr:hypothetical protein [Patescibacteria group bacterium]
MLKHNFFTYSSQIILKTIIEILYFPIWWYSLGLIETINKGWRFWLERERSLGFRIWVKNIFVPMYGQNDWAGRLISFFIRLVQIVFRALILLFWLAIYIAIILIWLSFPILLFIALSFQLGSFYGV